MGFPTHVPDTTVLRAGSFYQPPLALFTSWLTILLILDHHHSPRAETAQGFLILLFMAIGGWSNGPRLSGRN